LRSIQLIIKSIISHRTKRKQCRFIKVTYKIRTLLPLYHFEDALHCFFIITIILSQQISTYKHLSIDLFFIYNTPAFPGKKCITFYLIIQISHFTCIRVINMFHRNFQCLFCTCNIPGSLRSILALRNKGIPLVRSNQHTWMPRW